MTGWTIVYTIFWVLFFTALAWLTFTGGGDK